MNDLGRDHRKIVVIDGKIAYTGGYDVANHWHKEPNRWVNGAICTCRIEGIGRQSAAGAYS